MNIEVIKKPKSTVLVKGSIPAEEFNACVRHVTRKFTAESELSGFRKGKAPEHMVVQKIGDGAILEEAANEALSNAYPAILKDHNLDAIGRPQIRITKLARGNPLEFEAELAVLPAIPLPAYKDIAKQKNAEPKEKPAVTDEELAQTLDWLRKSRTADKEHPPELTDEFAKSVGAFNTVEELKNAIRENMAFEKEEKARDKRRMELLDAITQKTTLEIPDILIASEKEKMLAELKNGTAGMGMRWEDYLRTIKKTEGDLKNEWQTDAERRVKSALVLGEIAKKESLEPTEEECGTWAEQFLASHPEEEKKGVDVNRVKDYAYGVLRNQNVFHFLENSG